MCASYPGRRVIQRQLGEMERMGLVAKKIFAEVPLRVEYSLAERGRSLVPIIKMIDDWGLRHASLFYSLGNYTGDE